MLWKGVVMNDLLETQASRRRVGCAGIVVADLFCGPMDALPQEGMLSVLEEMPSRAGGCAANVAIDLVRQGVEVDLYGCIGAGDAFCSGVIASILNGADMGDMLRHASAIGFSATRAIGTTDGVFGAAEAADFLQTHHLDLIEGDFTY